jgi:phospholipid/cholesterol/gamma-HCH transport system ATP-binding protein
MQTPLHVDPVALRVNQLHKSYGAQEVLHGIDFAVQPGEIFCLMGPSGSGKSVLLRQIIGLEQPDQGGVEIGGLPANDPKTHQRFRTALVFQAGALFNSMSVYDNLALYPREHRLYSEAVIRDKVLGVMAALSLEHAADKIPAQLSGGMRKRVSVARAIIMEPQLILYDEPTSELDPILAATTSELIATVCRETHATTIVVTHDRQLAFGIADHVALLLNGSLAFCGTRDALKQCSEPAVQDFLNPVIDLANPRFRQQENAL